MSYTSNYNKRFKRDASPSNKDMYSNNSNSYQNMSSNYQNDSQDLYHKPTGGMGGRGGVNKVLLYTILNQRYVITLEAISKISNRFGNVQRIVMIRKKSTQAMVEFETVEEASKAMENLQNQDIYSGCCTLKIDYSKAQKLNVRKNDPNSWDFTVQPTLTADATRQPLIANGPDMYEQQSYGNNQPGGPPQSQGGYNQNQGPNRSYNNSSNYGGSQHGGYNSGPPHGGNPNHNYNNYNQNNQGMGPGGHIGGGQTRTPVAIVYGLVEDKVNCTHLFNILCLYGNVAKVKFMKSKPGCAMVEFNDTEAVTKATKLTGAELFGSKLTIRPSKSMFVGEPKGESFVLFDKSPGFEDFSHSKFNRFSTHDKASKNRVQEPRPTIHFFNAPVDAEEDDIRDLINEIKHDGDNFAIQKFVMFPKKEKSKSTAGLITFETVNAAMITLAELNHRTMDSKQSAYPYNVKFCFATQDLKDQQGQQ